MDLRCKLGHMRNGVILVNGTEYKVDKDGIVTGLSDDDAQILLQNPEGWDRNTVVRKPPSKAAESAAPSTTMETTADAAPPSTTEAVAPSYDPESTSRRRGRY